MLPFSNHIDKYLVVPHVERVLDDAADHLRRETRELGDERSGDGVEVVLLVSLEAAGGPDFSHVRNIISRGESCTSAEHNRENFIHEILGQLSAIKRRLT